MASMSCQKVVYVPCYQLQVPQNIGPTRDLVPLTVSLLESLPPGQYLMIARTSVSPPEVDYNVLSASERSLYKEVDYMELAILEAALSNKAREFNLSSRPAKIVRSGDLSKISISDDTHRRVHFLSISHPLDNLTEEGKRAFADFAGLLVMGYQHISLPLGQKSQGNR